MHTKHIALIGRGLGVLQSVHDLLLEQGYQASFTNSIEEINDKFASQPIDLVLIGAAWSEEQRATIRQNFQDIKPDVAFLQASAPIPSMIVEQVAGALTGKQPLPTAPQYNAASKALRIELPETSSVMITCYWIVSQETAASDLQEIHNGQMDAGEYHLEIPTEATTHWSFATVSSTDYFMLIPLTPRR